MQCIIATKIDPYTYCAAIIISTSNNPQPCQLSTIVTNLSLILDIFNLGNFSIKMITRITSDTFRYVFLLKLVNFLYLIFLLCVLRGKAVDLVAVDLKKSKASTFSQYNKAEAHPQDFMDKVF